MNYRKTVNLFIVCFVFTAMACTAQKSARIKKNAELLNTIDKNLTDAVAQYKVMMKNISEDQAMMNRAEPQFPKTYHPTTNKFETSNSGWWCSGFYPGTLLYLYELRKDTTLYREAIRILKPLEKEQFNKNTHDLGFMMFCSFGNATRLAATHRIQ